MTTLTQIVIKYCSLRCILSSFWIQVDHSRFSRQPVLYMKKRFVISVSAIPQDALLNILSYLRYVELFRFSLTCKLYCQLINNLDQGEAQWIWKQTYRNEILPLYKNYTESDICLSVTHTDFKKQLQSRTF
jgi:hypothetical protein